MAGVPVLAPQFMAGVPVLAPLFVAGVPVSDSQHGHPQTETDVRHEEQELTGDTAPQTYTNYLVESRIRNFGYLVLYWTGQF